MISSRKGKAVGLFSGSLDSILATKLLVEQGVSVVALHFRVPFSIPGRVPSAEQLQLMAKLLSVSLVSVDVGDDYLELVRTPQWGYIRHLAPCLDCRAYMLRKAKELLEEIKADFVFTGEVLGQQPFSQNKRSLKLLEKVSGLDGRLLRPLSAKILEPTVPELTGLVRRERFFDFHGQKRRRQIRLAREFGIVEYPIPGGGCLLADRNFAVRCREAIEKGELSRREIELLRYGRHFRLASGAKVIVGRNERENAVLERLAAPEEVVCRPVEVVGPVVLYRPKRKSKRETETVARICARYSDAPPGQAVRVKCGDAEFSVKGLKDEDLERWRIAAESADSGPAAGQQDKERDDTRDKREDKKGA